MPMSKSIRVPLLLAVLFLWSTADVQSQRPAAPDQMVYDVVIYGCTSAGIAAAIQTHRLGKAPVVVCPDTHLGGLTAGGLGWTDSGRKETIGGFAREFYQRVKAHYDYPDASYERRREIAEEHENYQKGLMWFLANDPRVPEDVRAEMSQWGLAKDEFIDNGHWPHQLYVREARRLVGDFVMTEPHLRGLTLTPRVVGMGSYNMDSHNVQRYVDADGNVRNEGDIQVNPGGPYPISYLALVPEASEASNMLVPVCLSASHIAYGSIRMEPVFMVLGQSAATAAVLAIEDGVSVQQVSYIRLREQLLEDGQVLRLP